MKNNVRISLLVILALTATSCSHYKQSWSCKNPSGIGCSSIEYADEVARRNIILNENKIKPAKKVTIDEHYSDFEHHGIKEEEL